MRKHSQLFLTNTLAVLAVIRCLAAAPPSSTGTVRFNVRIEDLPAALAPQQAIIQAHIVTAARLWTDLVETKACEIQIVFGIRDVVDGDPKKLGYGKSRRSVSFGQTRQGDKSVAEQGWASLLRTGRHPQVGEPDVEIGFQSAYVIREFWWDPDPIARTMPVPRGKLDALSVILHELGHAMAFNGWIDPDTGKPRGRYLSTYDRWVQWDGRDFHFGGPEAVRICGKPILLAHSVNNYHHLGEERADVPIDPVLRNDLMTGYHFQWAKRYSITPLDAAILQDCGIQRKR